MPPRSTSRYLGSYGLKDESGRLYLTERKPFRYDAKLPGTVRHVMGQKEQLWHVAYQYYKPFPNAEHLWWVIAEFQPKPIMDLTLDIEMGTIIYVPSLRVVLERVIGH